MAKTKKILLRNTGNYAVVDADDYDRIAAFGAWYENDSGYAIKKTRIKGKNVCIRMHKVINDTPDGLVTDHINDNRLDNRKSNLRSVGQMINSWNSKSMGRPHTKYDLPSGVSYDKSRNKYVAVKTIRKRFDTLEEAVNFAGQSMKEEYARQ